MSGAGVPRAGSASHASHVSRFSRIVGGVIGFALLALAVWIAVRERQDLLSARDAIAHASAWLIALLLLMPLLSWSLTALMYCVLTNRDRDVLRRRHIGLGEMHSVLGSAWLLNYLPARPGMVGRLMYHTLVNRMPLPTVVKASVAALLCGVVATAMLVAIAFALLKLAPGASGVVVVTTLLVPCVLLAIASWLLRAREGPRRLLLGLLARYGDVLTWLVRYACLFAMLGRPVSVFEAAALAGATQAANMVPLIGNGIGIREWANTLLAPALPAGTAGVAALTQGLVRSAELVHRAAEFLVALPVGIISMSIVSRRIAAARAAERLAKGNG